MEEALEQCSSPCLSSTDGLAVLIAVNSNALIAEVAVDTNSDFLSVSVLMGDDDN